MSMHLYGQSRKLGLTASDLRQLADVLDNIQSIQSVEVRTVHWNGRTVTLGRSTGHQLDPMIVQLDDITYQSATTTRSGDTGAQR